METIKEYHENGHLKDEYTVNDKGQMHGECKAWYDNGQLELHTYFKNDKMNGDYKGWMPDGKLIISKYVENNKCIIDYLKK